MNREQILRKIQPKINALESLDKEAILLDLLRMLDDVTFKLICHEQGWDI